jgi:hypothetical protein
MFLDYDGPPDRLVFSFDGGASQSLFCSRTGQTFRLS